MIRLLLALLLPIAAHATDWQLDAGASELGFNAEAQGERFDGRFQRFEAAIRFDPVQLDASRFEVRIELASVDSQNSERDDMLAEPEFFDSDTHAQATYRAERFTALGNGRFRADGELQLRGVTRPVALEFDWQSDDRSARLSGTATLDRLAFGVGSGDWEDPEVVAHEVEVRTRLTLRRAERAHAE